MSCVISCLLCKVDFAVCVALRYYISCFVFVVLLKYCLVYVGFYLNVCEVAVVAVSYLYVVLLFCVVYFCDVLVVCCVSAFRILWVACSFYVDFCVYHLLAM